MKIVSMATKSYNDWICSFYYSIRDKNPDVDIIIYLLNYTSEEVMSLRSFFPDVTFIERNQLFREKSKGVFYVTYLKGILIGEVIAKHNEDVLWIDITANIRTNLDDVEKKLSKHDCLLIQRVDGVTDGKTAFAAEIFGMSTKNKLLYKRYALHCKNNKGNWFADQIGLTKFKYSSKNIGNLKFGEFCNFHYDPQARTWSDRGKQGKGKKAGDEHWVKDQFYNDLIKRIPTYEEAFKSFKQLFINNKPQILCFTDDSKWCYTTSAARLSQELSKWFNIKIINDVKTNLRDVYLWNGDLIWARCSSVRAQKLLKHKKDYVTKTIASVTTGGQLGEDRAELHLKHAKGHVGILTQNQQVADCLKDSPQLVFSIPNGIDTRKFKPVDRNPEKRFVVGFAGRHKTHSADVQKGFTDFFLKPCKELGVDYKYADSTTNFINHDDMPKFYDSIDVLIQASHSEGCSNTINEAMASGIPCIITKVGYHGEQCKHMENVIFVERDVEQIKEAINLLKDEKLYKKLSEGARKFAEEHSWDKIAHKYKDAFDKCIEKAKHL